MIALHGFLGLPTDFERLLQKRISLSPDWMKRFPMVKNALPTIAKTLNSTLHDNVLLGYSMGGRLGLHMLIDEPKKFKAAIIVSSSPGMIASENRIDRESTDLKWATRFLCDPWEKVIGDWNAQSVFTADASDELQRLERDYDREDLARALIFGSVASQADLREPLSQIDLPILWVAGEKDAKYSALARECSDLNPRFQYSIIPNAGHRVPWGNTPAFERTVEQFLCGLGTLTI